ncbi:MAG TPA: transposase, partial [Trebonia sp.]|nr:transposase [Trebonia sp.]
VPGAGSKQKTGRCLLECLKNREDDVLRFTTDLRIPPTSSQAERDLRPFALWSGSPGLQIGRS